VATCAKRVGGGVGAGGVGDAGDIAAGIVSIVGPRLGRGAERQGFGDDLVLLIVGKRRYRADGVGDKGDISMRVIDIVRV